MMKVRSIFHIATPVDAVRLERAGSLSPASLATEGFVHCSMAASVVRTTERHLNEVDDLVLIELATDKLDDEIRWPEVYPGEQFPHLYGPIPLAAVVKVHRWRPEDRQNFA